MKIKSQLKVGGVAIQFDIDEAKEMEALNKAITLSNPPRLCTNCQDMGLENKHLTSNKDKEGNIYVNIKCSCGAKAKLGQYKTGGYFWHRGFEVYTGGAKK